MTAKEKAEELVLKFLRIENNTPEWFNTHIAKQCALICVDEIRDNLPLISEIQDFWTEVKNEIIKL